MSYTKHEIVKAFWFTVSILGGLVILVNAAFIWWLVDAIQDGERDAYQKYGRYKYGYINHAGKWAIKPQWDYASSFVDGVAYVYNQPPYDPAEYSDYYNRVGRYKNDWARNEKRSAYINLQGRYITRLSNDGGVRHSRFNEQNLEYSEGLYARRLYDGQEPLYGFFDENNREVITPMCLQTGNFKNGLAPCKVKLY